jgi:transposase
MAAALGLRNDFDAAHLRAIAKQSKEAAQTRRLLALAAIFEGASRTEVAKIGGVTVQIVRDWMVRFNAHGPEGLINRKAPGRQARLKSERRTARARIVESGPDLALHCVVRWRLIDLCRWALAKLINQSISNETFFLTRDLLGAMGQSWRLSMVHARNRPGLLP